MGLKASQFFTASRSDNGVVIWDTTLRPMCAKLKEYDTEALGYDSLTRKLPKGGEYRFTTKSGVEYIVQHLVR